MYQMFRWLPVVALCFDLPPVVSGPDGCQHWCHFKYCLLTWLAVYIMCLPPPVSLSSRNDARLTSLNIWIKTRSWPGCFSMPEWNKIRNCYSIFYMSAFMEHHLLSLTIDDIGLTITGNFITMTMNSIDILLNKASFS